MTMLCAECIQGIRYGTPLDNWKVGDERKELKYGYSLVPNKRLGVDPTPIVRDDEKWIWSIPAAITIIDGNAVCDVHAKMALDKRNPIGTEPWSHRLL